MGVISRENYCLGAESFIVCLTPNSSRSPFTSRSESYCLPVTVTTEANVEVGGGVTDTGSVTIGVCVGSIRQLFAPDERRQSKIDLNVA